MNALFVTGTDTGVGKTHFCGLMLDYLLRQGVDAAYQKWVCTGTGSAVPEDLAACFAVAGQAVDGNDRDLLVPYSFRFAASPHLAAKIEGALIDTAVIAEQFASLRARHQRLLVEGVGGILVPLKEGLLLADLVRDLEIPVLVIARSGLGTLNHTLLTLEALRARKIPVAGVVFSDSSPDESEVIVQDNMNIIAEMGRVHVLGRIPFCRDIGRAKELFRPVGEALGKVLGNVR